MAYKSKADYNAFMRVYNKKRRAERLERFKRILGDRCAKCGATNGLEIDHIDPSTKSFTIGGNKILSSEAVLLEELKKCQLLCRICHNEKTLLDTGKLPAKGTHGTLSSYRYCRCSLCRAAKAKYMKEYVRPSRTSG